MMQRNEIEQIANNVLKKYDIENAPFSHIKEVCEQEHINLKKTNFSSEMDGAFSIVRNEKYVFYNLQMIEGRQNFTKAHELGHYFLNHQLEAGNMIYCYNQHVSEGNQQAVPRIETEANYFATYFLMPKQLILKEYQVIANFLRLDTSRPLYVDKQCSNNKSWLFVSRHFVSRFGVSKEALGYRLDSLGVIDYNK